MVVGRRPPKMKAEMGTPSGSSQSGSMVRALAGGGGEAAVGVGGGLAGRFADLGGPAFAAPVEAFGRAARSVMPSHQTPPSGVRATLVKMVLRASVAMALGLVLAEVPGATPKKPASGLMARSWPVASGLIQAMSSPTVQTFQPSKPAGGIIMAKLVLPQAEGKAAAT